MTNLFRMNSLNSMKLIGVASAALTTVLLAAGCATTDSASTTAATRDEPVYRTGSNIPVHEKALTKEEKAKQAEDSQRYLQQMQTTGAGNPKN